MEENSNAVATKTKATRNDEFGFLYKKCKKIKPYIITAIAHVPQFMDAIRVADNNGIVWSDEQLYDVLKQRYKSMRESGVTFQTATNIMNKISKSVFGDSSVWRK